MLGLLQAQLHISWLPGQPPAGGSTVVPVPPTPTPVVPPAQMLQPPLTQLSPWKQTLKQVPQSLGSCWRLTQAPPQFTSGLWQVTATQEPAWQIWLAPQAMPQPPQLLGSLKKSSQPQLHTCRPTGQAMPVLPVVPVENVASLTVPSVNPLVPRRARGPGCPPVPFWLRERADTAAGLAPVKPKPPTPLELPLNWQPLQAPPRQLRPAAHTSPQTPQLSGSCCRFTHVPLQSDWPVGQTLPWHLPFSQPTPVAHTLPQLPQLSGSVCRKTHEPLGHSVWPTWVHCAHSKLPWQRQVEAMQLSPAGQTWLQAPQLLLSLVTLVQTPPQFTVPWPHTGGAHLPALQVSPWGQMLPQVPQLLGSVCRVTQKLPHAVWPLAHWQPLPPVPPLPPVNPPEKPPPVTPPKMPHWHSPFSQYVPALQALPQVPQLLLSNWVSVQVPLQEVVGGRQPWHLSSLQASLLGHASRSRRSCWGRWRGWCRSRRSRRRRW